MVRRLNRRTMLRGASGALLALPYLDAMAAPTALSEVPMRMDVQRIAAESAKDGYRLRDLILRIATSETFRRR